MYAIATPYLHRYCTDQELRWETRNKGFRKKQVKYNTKGIVDEGNTHK